MSIPILYIPIQSTTVKPYIFEGDTIKEIVIESDEFPDLTTSQIKMQVYYGNSVVLSVTNDNGITVNSSTSFTIDEISSTNNPFTEGKFIGDVEIIDANDIKKTYFRVIYKIEKQYSK
jgi:hypothetical protein